MENKEYELWSIWGSTQKEDNVVLGPHSSYEWNHTPRALLFTMARYKFAMKMIGNMYEPNKKTILDLGCSDGFGVHFVAEYAKSVLGVDFDEDAIGYAKKMNTDPKIEFRQENFLNQKYGDFDGIVSFDVIEHIYPENEDKYMETVLMNLNSQGGVFCIGTPSLEHQQFSAENVAASHVNCYTGERLYAMLKRYFYNVSLFSQNDEIIHTGHLRMANYLIAVCSHKKEN